VSRIASARIVALADVRAFNDKRIVLASYPEQIAKYRLRLSSVRWLMAKLDEFIARAANKDDRVKGRLWESRFKCQAIGNTCRWRRSKGNGRRHKNIGVEAKTMVGDMKTLAKRQRPWSET
jgi:hypothetical protein